MVVPKAEIRQLKEFSDINGVQRAPGAGENLKNVYWDNSTGRYKYRDDVHVSSAGREGASNRAEFTLTDGSKVYLELGALAWSDDTVESSPVTSVFGRTGAVLSQVGDYTAAQVTNAFDVSSDSLDDIIGGSNNVHLTTVLRSNYDYAYSVAHSHSNKSILDSITSVGSGKIVTDAERALWNSYAANSAEFIQDTVAAALINSSTISWTYNDVTGKIYATADLSSIDTDDLPEGNTNLYYTEDRVYASLSVTQTQGIGTLSFDNQTGVFYYVPPTTGQIRSAISASYPISYSPVTGIISWAGGEWNGGGSVPAPTTLTVSQQAHGFSLYNAIKIDQQTGLWVKAQADTEAKAGTMGIVVGVLNANSFTYQFDGYIEYGNHPYNIGEPYFLSPTTAGLVAAEPTYEEGQVREWIWTAVEGGLILALDQGEVVGGGILDEIPSGTVQFVAAGEGMDFQTFSVTGYVTLGTPSSISSISSNSVTTNSHSHELSATGVVAGTYNYSTITVDSKGRITSASTGTTPSLTVYSVDSIVGSGTLASPFKLSGDVSLASPNTIYGANELGVRGWYSVNDISNHYEDILFDFNDITPGTSKKYTLDIEASYTYDVKFAVLESDGTLTNVYVMIDDVPILGLDSITVSSKGTSTAISYNTVTSGSRLTISTSSGYSGSPTYLRGKIKYKRI